MEDLKYIQYDGPGPAPLACMRIWLRRIERSLQKTKLDEGLFNNLTQVTSESRRVVGSNGTADKGTGLSK